MEAKRHILGRSGEVSLGRCRVGCWRTKTFTSTTLGKSHIRTGSVGSSLCSVSSWYVWYYVQVHVYVCFWNAYQIGAHVLRNLKFEIDSKNGFHRTVFHKKGSVWATPMVLVLFTFKFSQMVEEFAKFKISPKNALYGVVQSLPCKCISNYCPYK